jgi:hypothetical protein
MEIKSRIVYIYANATKQYASSVQQKITQQIGIANEMDYPVQGWFFTTEELIEGDDETIRWFQVPKVESGYFQSLRQHAANMRSVLRKVNELDQPHYRYFMRFGICNSSLLRLSYLLRHRIVFNHLSVETDEYRLYQTDAHSQASRFLSKLEFKWLPIILDKTLGRIIRKNSKGAVVNSSEIAVRQQKQTLGKYHCEIIPDGVDVKRLPLLSTKSLKDTINMVFLKGASMDAHYNGLDRLMGGMLGYQGERNFSLTIIGNHTGAEQRMAALLGMGSRVTFKQAIYGKALDAELEKYELGVGPLAVHRKGIHETSSIKTREYFGRGLPFFIAHPDKELSANSELGKFYQEFEANETAIDLEELEGLFDRLNAVPDYPARMRELAAQILDYRVKIPKWISFLTS